MLAAPMKRLFFQSLHCLLAPLASLALAASPLAAAVDGDALLDALVAKGVLSRAEASALVLETQQPANPALVVPASKSVTKLVIGGRIQAQFVALSADESVAAEPADTLHFLLRRVYLTTRAEFGPAWDAGFVYDLANTSFDLAAIRWKGDDLSLQAGYRLVNANREQSTSSGALKAIERSAATRYFVEDAAGANLGAGGYRVGVFAEGTPSPLFWGAAITNPEAASNLAVAKAPGTSATNSVAFWLNGGFERKSDSGRLLVGAGLGYLPDQGGAPVGGAGTGDDIATGNVFFDLTSGRFALLAEFFAARDEDSSVSDDDALCLGGFIQPSWVFTPALEGVFRIGYLDTDERGVSLKNTIPGAGSAITVDRLFDTYLGGTWYLRGNDLKLQAGLIYARGDGNPAGGNRRVETYGARSQLQMNF
jgi:hypothetical protein